MDIVNFPGIIAEHGLLSSAQLDLAKDLLLIGKKMGPQRDGTQYENMAITVAEFAALIGGGGNETLAQTLALGNVTGGNDIIVSSTDNLVFDNGTFTGTLINPVWASNVTWNLPSTSGTLALLSDIPLSWEQDGNTNGALKYIGTNDTYDFPVYTDGNEVARFMATGEFAIGATNANGQFVYLEKDQNSYTHVMVANRDSGSSASAAFVANSENCIVYLGAGSSTHPLFPDAGSVGSYMGDFCVVAGQVVPASIHFYTNGLTLADRKMTIHTSGNIGIGVGITNPEASALLELRTTTQGFLAPRMTFAERNLIALPATGLLIYQLDNNPDYYYFDGTTWIAISSNIYANDGVVGSNRVATLNDNLTFTGANGNATNMFGIGQDPMGWGQGGILQYSFDTPGVDIEAWGGLFDSSSAINPYWLHEVYDVPGNTAGHYSSWSAAYTTPFANMYYHDITSGLYKGFEANKNGEQLFSQRLGVSVTAMTVNDRVLFTNNTGYIKATTFAGLSGLLNSTISNIYNNDGVITDSARNVTVNNTLNFIHGPLAVNGSFQIQSGGYVRNATANVNAYFEYDHNQGSFKTQSDSHSTTGFKSVRIGTGGNPTGGLSLLAGSTGVCYLDLLPTTPRFDFYVNNTGIWAGSINGATGNWTFGSLFGVASTVVTVQGRGSTSATNSIAVNNSGGSRMFTVTDGGLSMFNTTSTSSIFSGGIKSTFADSTVTDPTAYANTSVISMVYSPTANATGYVSSLRAGIIKYGIYNATEVTAISALARNDSTGGTINGFYGCNLSVWGTQAGGNANNMFAYRSTTQITNGSAVNYGGFKIDFEANSVGTTITNMMGVFITTPVNTGGVVTNTYSLLAQGNSIGVNNYGVVIAGYMTNGFGVSAPNQNAMLHIKGNFAPVFKAHVYFEPLTSIEASGIVPSNGMGIYVSDTSATFPVVGGSMYKYQNGAWMAW